MTPTLLGIFLIAHAIVHAGLTTAPDPSDPESTPVPFSHRRTEAGFSSVSILFQGWFRKSEIFWYLSP